MSWHWKKKNKQTNNQKTNQKIADWWNHTCLSLAFVYGGTTQQSLTEPFESDYMGFWGEKTSILDPIRDPVRDPIRSDPDFVVWVFSSRDKIRFFGNS